MTAAVTKSAQRSPFFPACDGPWPIFLVVDSALKTFGALRAVDDVSLTVREGEIFGVAGPNGSGKSTLFNIITAIPFHARWRADRVRRQIDRTDAGL